MLKKYFIKKNKNLLFKKRTKHLVTTLTLCVYKTKAQYILYTDNFVVLFLFCLLTYHISQLNLICYIKQSTQVLRIVRFIKVLHFTS